MLKALIFDLDGTITKLTLPLEAMRRDTKRYYIDRGMPADLLEPADGISSSKYKARQYFISKGISEEEWARMEGEVDSLLNCHEGDAAKAATLIEGALDVVRQIRSLGLKTAILTNNGRHAVDIIRERIPLDDFFEVIQTRNESPNPKPYPDGLLKLCEQLGVQKSEVAYVGDASIDGVAAQRAGIEFWGVTTGETSRETLLESGASVVFGSLEGVYEEARRRVEGRAD